MDFTQHTYDLSLEAKGDDKLGTFEGYGSIFGNQDRDGDVVSAGAFVSSLSQQKPALLWQHDQKQPIGTFDEVREDKRGLYVKGRLAMSGRGKEAYDLLKMGALNGLSIGFVTKEASRDHQTGVRTIHEADLMEVSLVTFPANELARVSAVKSATEITDERKFERFLREAGYSRTQAKAITAKGFKGLNGGLCEADEVQAIELALQLKARAAKLTQN